MRRTAVLLLLIVSLAPAADGPALELEDPVLPGMNLTDSRAEYRKYLENDGWKLSGDEWCLWGERESEDVAYCFDDAGELLSVEYNRCCPGDSWVEVSMELGDLLSKICGPRAYADDDGDYWSCNGWEIALTVKYLDTVNPVVHLLIER